MNKAYFGNILIMSSALVINSANASLTKLNIDKTIIKDRKITPGQTLRALGINTKVMNKADIKTVRENLNYLKSLGYDLKSLAKQKKITITFSGSKETAG